MKRISRLRSKKAYTLVEVLVATTITAILLTAVFTLFQPVSKLISSLSTSDTIVSINNTVSSYITNSLNDANAAKLYTGVDLSVVNDDIATDIAKYRTNYNAADDTPKLLYFAFDETENTYYAYAIDLKTDLKNAAHDDGSWTQTQWETWLKTEANWNEFFKDDMEYYRLFNRDLFDGNKISFEFERIANTSTNRYFISYKINLFECENGFLANCTDITADDAENYITYSLPSAFELLNAQMAEAPAGTDDDILIVYNVHKYTA